ncbi:hypothetical protein RCL_jg2987.t1 [Rhizophagus clarus]|uniref:Uncharacterized protein n=1 Tax=Rhizophagus clarus TaxID=94130 RepID=A0A8H3MBQ6_9GLOM|nr:hypothetical protein RCL_jg2987.t1 [Rhizophagus clarus]
MLVTRSRAKGIYTKPLVIKTEPFPFFSRLISLDNQQAVFLMQVKKKFNFLIYLIKMIFFKSLWANVNVYI